MQYTSLTADKQFDISMAFLRHYIEVETF